MNDRRFPLGTYSDTILSSARGIARWDSGENFVREMRRVNVHVDDEAKDNQSIVREK